MATETKNQKPLEEAMQKLKVDPSAKVTDGNVSTVKKGNLSEVTSMLSSGGDATSSVKGSDVDQDSVTPDQGLYYPGSYYGYYYPGMDGSYGEWDDQGYFVSGDGFDYAYPGINPNDGSAFYYFPGGGYVQPPLTPYMPAPFVGLDGQYLGQQPYISAPFYPQVPSPGYLAPPVPYGSEIMPAYSWDTSPFLVDVANVNGISGGPLPPGPKSNSSVPPTPVTSHFKTMPFVKSTPSVDTKVSPPAPELLPSPVNAVSANIHHQPIKLANKVARQTNGFQTPGVVPKSFFPIAKFPPYSNALKSSLAYPNSHMGFKTNSRGWANGVKGRTKVNGGTDFDLLSEQNRGPRTSNGRDSWVSDVDAVECLGAGTHSKSSGASLIRRDHYNLSDFPVKYEMALCFVIKSYSEDDVHKSIKYNVWASTPNGNKRLDSAYQDAQEWSKEKGSKCPVFLFFSVNASGQFCGVAEMTGRVDFTKSMDFWQQDKWNGFFSVKWHIIKDIPNTQFRHIILENNDNKPVTNSRDTQEVKFPQGIEMLGIFKNFNTKTSILDDFDFYEGRQKAMQDKKFLPPSILEQPQPQKMPDEAAIATVKVNEMKPAVASFGQPMGVAAVALKKNNSGQVGGEGKL